jgi:two-component system OmpR family sensor kinase
VSRTPRAVSRLPLRVRLVAGFSATMLLVLLAAGGFVYWRVQFALDRQVNTDLSEAATRLSPLVAAGGTLRTTASAADRNETYQILDRQGQVLSSSPTAGSQPLLNAADAQHALTVPVHRDIGALLPINNHPLRAYAVPLPNTGGAAAVLVVAVRRDHRDEALLELLAQLGVAGLAALILTSSVGYLLARSALQPVERYRAQAARIINGDTGVRLDVPNTRHDEVTRLGRTLNTMLDALDAALERERDFVQDASHELRTPVTLLKTRVQLALRRPRSVTEHEAILREVQTDLDRLNRLAEQLLRKADPPTGADPETSDLTQIAARAVERRNQLLPKPDSTPSGHTFLLDATGPVTAALGPVEITQLLDNLLDNAVLHGQPPVHVAVTQSAGWAILRVQDAGPGMEPQLLATATHRFTRAPESRARPGFGLGLSLVTALITAAGGELRLCYAGHHHQHGAQTPAPCHHGPQMTVTVLLPTNPPAAPDEPQAQNGRPPTAGDRSAAGS